MLSLSRLGYKNEYRLTYKRKTLEFIIHFEISQFKFGFTSTASKECATKVEKDGGKTDDVRRSRPNVWSTKKTRTLLNPHGETDML